MDTSWSLTSLSRGISTDARGSMEKSEELAEDGVRCRLSKKMRIY
jgi:hypothetical protein